MHQSPSVTARILLATFLATSLGHGQIVVDDSFGPGRTLEGPNYEITPDLGRTFDRNLFHSFADFNLFSDETAIFSGPGSILNILARVTGGKLSNIDGLLRSTIPDANFFFMNPSGVVFGPNAQLDVQGSFAVTTADFIQLADGGTFHASKPENTLLTSAPPSAFGFLSGNPQPIRTDRSPLAVAEGQTLSVVGGDLEITGGFLEAVNGHVNLVSVASEGTVTFDPADSSSIDTDSFSRFGDIQLREDAFVGVNGEGAVVIRGGNLLVDHSVVFSGTGEDLDGGGIEIRLADPSGDGGAGRLEVQNGGNIFVLAEGLGRAGDLSIVARTIVLDGEGSAETTALAAQNFGEGQGGDLRIEADTLLISNDAFISASNFGPGKGGSIEIVADSIEIFGGDSGFIGGILTITEDGDAGDIVIRANSLLLAQGAQINSETRGPGQAGSVDVDAGTLRMTGFFSGIFAGTTETGSGGRIKVTAESLEIDDGAGISTNTSGPGDGGSIEVNAGTLQITGSFSQISSLSFDSGSGGLIKITAESLEIDDGAGISTNTLGPGDGGSIELKAGTLRIGEFAGISAVVSTNSSGKGGNIAIDADRIEIGELGEISTTAFGSGDSGNIELSAEDFLVFGDITADTFRDGDAGDITIDVGQLLIVEGNITSDTAFLEGSTGSGGSIRVRADIIEIGSFGAISTTTSGSGPGGNIELQAEVLLLDGTEGPAFIEADSNQAGDAGSIDIDVGRLQMVGSTFITSTSGGAGAGGLVKVVADRIELFSDAQIRTSAGPLSSGRGGNIELTTDTLLIDDGTIAVGTSGSGDGGTIEIVADQVTITGFGFITGSTTGSGRGGNVRIESRSLEILDGFIGVGTTSIVSGITSGNAGSVEIEAGRVLLTASSSIGAESGGSGKGGDIKIRADSLEVLDDATIQSFAFDSGDGGTITIQAGNLRIEEGGTISTTTFSSGDGGVIDVTVDGELSMGSFGSISSEVAGNSTGNGGSIAVHANRLILEDFATITAENRGEGNAGNIAVRANDARLNNFSSISVETTKVGDAGNITLDAENLEISKGARIDSSTRGEGKGGNVIIRAKTLLLQEGGIVTTSSTGSGNAGNIIVAAQEIVLRDDSRLSTSAELASGGDITITASRSIDVENSQISAEAQEDGGNIRLSAGDLVQLLNSSLIAKAGRNGGSIIMDSPTGVVIVDQSQVVADAVLGDGGDILITAQGFLASPDSRISASSEFGVAGNIEIVSPATDLAGSLAQLPESLLSAWSTLQDQCTLDLEGDISSFVVVGRGALPVEPGRWLPSLLLRPATGDSDDSQ